MLTGRELPVPSNVPPDAALYQRMSWLGSGLGVAETAPTAVPQPVSPTGAVGGLGLFSVNTTELEMAWLAQILLTARMPKVASSCPTPRLAVRDIGVKVAPPMLNQIPEPAGDSNCHCREPELPVTSTVIIPVGPQANVGEIVAVPATGVPLLAVTSSV